MPDDLDASLLTLFGPNLATNRRFSRHAMVNLRRNRFLLDRMSRPLPWPVMLHVARVVGCDFIMLRSYDPLYLRLFPPALPRIFEDLQPSRDPLQLQLRWDSLQVKEVKETLPNAPSVSGPRVPGLWIYLVLIFSAAWITDLLEFWPRTCMSCVDRRVSDHYPKDPIRHASQTTPRVGN